MDVGFYYMANAAGTFGGARCYRAVHLTRFGGLALCLANSGCYCWRLGAFGTAHAAPDPNLIKRTAREVNPPRPCFKALQPRRFAVVTPIIATDQGRRTPPISVVQQAGKS